MGVRLSPDSQDGPHTDGRVCSFEIVKKAADHSEGTVAGGDATCPFSDCGRVVDGDEIKRQAQAGEMGEQLYAIVFKRRIERVLKSGRKGKPKWERGYRAPRPEDDNSEQIQTLLDEKLPEWQAMDVVPGESVPSGAKTDEALRYGFRHWHDMFAPRQLLGHGFAVETFREMVEEDRAAGRLTDLRNAAYIYLALSLDKLRDYNSRMTRWHSGREVMVNTFDRHDFAFKWSYAEMAIMVEGLGYDWAIEQTKKCIGELVELTSAQAAGPLFQSDDAAASHSVTTTCKSGASLDHVSDGTVDAVIMDPPYGANVHVCRACRLLLCLAEAHGGASHARAIYPPPDRQGYRSRRQ